MFIIVREIIGFSKTDSKTSHVYVDTILNNNTSSKQL